MPQAPDNDKKIHAYGQLIEVECYSGACGPWGRF